MRLIIRPSYWPCLLQVALALGLAFASLSINAQGQQQANPDFWEKYDDLTDWVTLRLQLTPEQEKDVLPVMQRSFAKQKSLLQSYGLANSAKRNLTPKQRGEIGAQLAVISAQSYRELQGMLNEKQLREASKIQREFLRAFAARLSIRAGQDE
ncbi:hypothetical protein [Microbulbifer spongiae]|uniref:Zinc resistance-associated protein n=1 Tax=Microbulbifer spongiae TaxID=2944933 RepID=A0ABY9E8W4_9GAMM|nr:hypothetical protein [Microbulbifer sp. MI-G]WKD48880.1 hypothetical protein M8T91_13365 [Microbulbifer sp. MI-G]